MDAFSPLSDASETPRSSHRRTLAIPLKVLLVALLYVEGAQSVAVLAVGLYMWAAYHRTGLSPPDVPGPHPPASVSSSWFIWTCIIVGVIGLIASIAGLSGTKVENRHRLLLFMYMISLLLLGESTALVLFFTMRNWVDSKLPGMYFCECIK